VRPLAAADATPLTDDYAPVDQLIAAGHG